MKSSGKKEIVDMIMQTEEISSKVSKALVKTIVDLTFQNTIQLTKETGGCRVAMFGSFVSVLRKARMATHPKTGAPIQIAEKQTIKFNAGSAFKEAVQDVAETCAE
jgi:DNA-binding protein HU-beta